jgi:hypothetical protein
MVVAVALNSAAVVIKIMQILDKFTFVPGSMLLHTKSADFVGLLPAN